VSGERWIPATTTLYDDASATEAVEMTSHREPLDSVPETVGEIPMIREGPAPEAISAYAKLESFDRIEADLRDGLVHASVGPEHAGDLQADLAAAVDGALEG
jgi:hypothetical protein